MPRDARARIVCEYAVQTLCSFVGAVGDGNLAGVQAVADADSAAVMKRNPACAARGVQERVERMGQSATASEPSFIASVSRKGEATDPVSR